MCAAWVLPFIGTSEQSVVHNKKHPGSWHTLFSSKLTSPKIHSILPTFLGSTQEANMCASLGATFCDIINAHCVLLRHYYSVNFPWWFDRKICRVQTKLVRSSFFVKLQSADLNFCHLTSFFFASIIPQSVFWSKSSNWSRGQTHDLILLNFFFYYITFYSIFSRLSLFHREWPQLATILTSFNLYLETVSKLLNIGIKASHSRWKQLDMQRIE